jgi:hypothetical protein
MPYTNRRDFPRVLASSTVGLSLALEARVA